MNVPVQQGIGMTSQRTRNRLVARLIEEGIEDKRVLDVIGRVPRHLFVDEALASRAYEDSPLPIGHGQTISQPYIVALMTQELLRDGIPKRVLEVGTGSGYQAAVLSELVDVVYTVERIEPLYKNVVQRFKEMGRRNIYCKLSDGSWGWESKGPFEAIMLTAAPSVVPAALFDQLSEGGRLIVPVGELDTQKLMLYRKQESLIVEEFLCSVRFVPLIGGGYSR